MPAGEPAAEGEGKADVIAESKTIYHCTVADSSATLATKHIDHLDVQIGSAMALSNLTFKTADGSGVGCGQNPPKSASMPLVKNRAKTAILKDLAEFKAESSSPLITDTCFVSFDLYVPTTAAKEASFQARATWSDTDGDFPTDASGKAVKGGDILDCKSN
jgi:hypothetical protein